MSDLIERQAILDGLEKYHENTDLQYIDGLTYAYDLVCKLPSVSTEKTGHWNVVSFRFGNQHICECSECKDTVWVYEDADRKWNYCPNCGARMGEVVDESVDECKREKLEAEESDKRVVDCKSLPCAHRRYGLLLPGSPQKCVDCLKEMYGIEEVEE